MKKWWGCRTWVLVGESRFSGKNHDMQCSATGQAGQAPSDVSPILVTYVDGGCNVHVSASGKDAPGLSRVWLSWSTKPWSHFQTTHHI